MVVRSQQLLSALVKKEVNVNGFVSAMTEQNVNHRKSQMSPVNLFGTRTFFEI